MFTGIVEEVGRVASLVRDGEAAQLRITCAEVVGDVALGDSIAVDGCCLTVTGFDEAGFTADLMAESLRATALGTLTVGTPVNLERALRADGRLGGHLVQGHVDAVGELVAVEEQPGTTWITLHAPGEVARYLVPKGSVTVGGVSLTVGPHVERSDDGSARFRIGLIPHTCAVTTLGTARVGDRVNLEADVIAKHVVHLLAAGADTPYRQLSPVTLPDAAPASPHTWDPDPDPDLTDPQQEGAR